MTTFCAVCGRGGQTAMVGNALEYRHFKPADHRFRVAAPRSQQDETEAPPPSSALAAQVPAVRPVGLPEQRLAASE